MKRRQFFIYPLLALLLTCTSAVAMGTLPEEPGFNTSEELYESTWRGDVLISSHDGVTIAANIFVPKAREPFERFPAIVMPSSWVMEEHEYVMQGAKLCRKGYIVLGYSPRGWGISEGQVNVGGPDDMADINAIIDWLIAYQPVAGVVTDDQGRVIDDSGAKIGMCGISLGGGLSLLGAAHDTRVKAVMAMVPWGDLAGSLYMNQTTKEVWHKFVLQEIGDLTGNFDPMIRELTGALFEHNHPLYYDSIITWAMERSPINFVDRLNRIDGRPRDIAVCLSNNLQDEMFPPNQILPFFYALETDKKRLDINQGVHGSNDIPGALGIASEAWNKAHAWFDEHLKGMDTGIMDLPPMSIDNKRNQDRNYVDHIYIKDINMNYLDGIYDPSNNVNTIRPETFFLGNRPWYRLYGTLNSYSQKKNTADTIRSGSLSGITTGIPILSSLLEAHTTNLHVETWFPMTNKGKSIVYQSEPMDRDRTIIGAPHVKLNITPTTDSFQLVAHLYTLDKNNVGTLFSHAPLTILGDGKFMKNARAGETLTVEFNLVTTCVTVEKGQRIALAIDTEDLNYGKAPDTDYKLTFSYDQNSTLSIPFVD
ncbi:CocE/NonD family hydrolase [Desulfatiferula olefinivorans]